MIEPTARTGFERHRGDAHARTGLLRHVSRAGVRGRTHGARQRAALALDPDSDGAPEPALAAYPADWPSHRADAPDEWWSPTPPSPPARSPASRADAPRS